MRICSWQRRHEEQALATDKQDSCLSEKPLSCGLLSHLVAILALLVPSIYSLQITVNMPGILLRRATTLVISAQPSGKLGRTCLKTVCLAWLNETR